MPLIDDGRWLASARRLHDFGFPAPAAPARGFCVTAMFPISTRANCHRPVEKHTGMRFSDRGNRGNRGDGAKRCRSCHCQSAMTGDHCLWQPGYRHGSPLRMLAPQLTAVGLQRTFCAELSQTASISLIATDQTRWSPNLSLPLRIIGPPSVRQLTHASLAGSDGRTMSWISSWSNKQISLGTAASSGGEWVSCLAAIFTSESFHKHQHVVLRRAGGILGIASCINSERHLRPRSPGRSLCEIPASSVDALRIKAALLTVARRHRFPGTAVSRNIGQGTRRGAVA